MTLYLGDCLTIMNEIPDASVDCVLADLPYGTTNCSWDAIIPLEPMWAHYKRIIKPGGAILLHAQQPFTTTLVTSNMKWFRYEWIWEKVISTGFLNAKKMPLKAHESVLVFYDRLPTYNPQMTYGHAPYLVRGGASRPDGVYGKFGAYRDKGSDGSRYPRSVLRFPHDNRRGGHPTQKPVGLAEYMIRTFTNLGDTVLDNTMGSGTTGVACINTGRHFIGIERDERYFAMARARIGEALSRR